MYFRDVIGQGDVKRHLIDSAQRGIVPHARLFYGREGVGKLPLAIAYARYLNCSHRGAEDACGACPSCHKFDKLAHPDLHFVYPVVKSKVSDDYLPQWRLFLSQNSYFSSGQWFDFISAQNAQGIIYSKESDEIIRKLNLKVYEARYKVMVVWLPEKMHEACANKLLKMIEEPPANTVFLLVSQEEEHLLQTIRSRCQPLAVHGIEDAEMLKALSQQFGLTETKAVAIAHIAHGSFTKAMQLVGNREESSQLFDLFVEMMRASVLRNIHSIRTIANEIAGTGREMQKRFLLNALRLFREYFVHNLGEPEMVYLTEEEQRFGERFAPFINEKNIETFNDEFSLAYRQIEQNGNAKIIFLDLCLKTTVLLKK